MAKATDKKAPKETREEKAKRLQFTEADQRAFDYVPPAPLSVEQLAELGQEWAQAVIRNRKHHNEKDQRHHHSGHRTRDGGYQCYGCQLHYSATPAWLEALS